jgi:taurine dioxygenase
MSYESISVTRLSPHIGAEIGRIDLTKPLSNRQAQEVHDALIENQVIFFRDQPIDVATLKSFGRLFGKLHIHPLKGMDGHPEVRALHADANSKHVSGEEWHTDMSCDPVPPMGSILYLHTLPPIGGDTIFASMYAAYDALSPRMKSFLEGLTATHDGMLAFGRFDPTKKYPVAVHPVITRHPVSKKKLIYVNRGFTARINELSPSESAALLAYLYQHLEKPDFQMRFTWRKHSIAFWDNRCSQHLAIWDYFPNTRSGWRVQVDADQPPLAA